MEFGLAQSQERCVCFGWGAFVWARDLHLELFELARREEPELVFCFVLLAWPCIYRGNTQPTGVDRARANIHYNSTFLALACIIGGHCEFESEYDCRDALRAPRPGMVQYKYKYSLLRQDLVFLLPRQPDTVPKLQPSCGTRPSPRACPPDRGHSDPPAA